MRRVSLDFVDHWFSNSSIWFAQRYKVPTGGDGADGDNVVQSTQLQPATSDLIPQSTTSPPFNLQPRGGGPPSTHPGASTPAVTPSRARAGSVGSQVSQSSALKAIDDRVRAFIELSNPRMYSASNQQLGRALGEIAGACDAWLLATATKSKSRRRSAVRALQAEVTAIKMQLLSGEGESPLIHHHITPPAENGERSAHTNQVVSYNGENDEEISISNPSPQLREKVKSLSPMESPLGSPPKTGGYATNWDDRIDARREDELPTAVTLRPPAASFRRASAPAGYPGVATVPMALPICAPNEV